MGYLSQKLMSASRRVAFVSILTALSVSFRYLKNALLPVQFVNIPLAFTMIAGLYTDWVGGALVGLLSYALSDTLISVGPWTLINGVLASLIGAVWSLFKRLGDTYLAVIAYLSTFFFDIFSSFLFYLAFGLPLREAFVTGLVGLFIPVYGGGLIGVGPVTEAITAIVVVGLMKSLKRVVEVCGLAR